MQLHAAALNPLGYPHYTEHLAPLCDLLSMPLLFSHEEYAEKAQKFYPHLLAQVVDPFTARELKKSYNTLFTSELWGRERFTKTFGEGMHHVHCPHGYSDKVFWLREAAFEEISLLYGPAMVEMLEKEEVLQTLAHFVMIGNMRYLYYQKYESFFDQVTARVLHFQKKQKTLLYAPTRMDWENSSTFVKAAHPLLEALPEDINLILKLHPYLREEATALVYQLEALYEDKPNVVILTDFPLVYPLLKQADVYLGDLSSLGYDFLTFDRPLFFLNPWTVKLPLFECGEVLQEPQDIYKKLDQKDNHQAIRKKVYQHAFGERRELSTIQHDLLQLLK